MTTEITEELGIIKDINIGMRDCSEPVIWFELQSLRGSSLQIISDIKKFIKEADCHKLSDLNGKPCVLHSHGMIQKFDRLL